MRKYYLYTTPQICEMSSSVHKSRNHLPWGIENKNFCTQKMTKLQTLTVASWVGGLFMIIAVWSRRIFLQFLN